MTAYSCEELRLGNPAERESQLLKSPTVGATGPLALGQPLYCLGFGETPGVGRAQKPALHATARALSLARATFAGRLAGSRGWQDDDGRERHYEWHATSMDPRKMEFP